jgi:hypothetical protein
LNFNLSGGIVLDLVNGIISMKIFEKIKSLVGQAQVYIALAVRRLLTSKAPIPQSETPSEIEYYSLLAAEVSRLPNNTRVARRALYDRIWVGVAAQLSHGQDPSASVPQIASEQLPFQKAICKVEIEMAMHEVERS